MEFNFLGNYPSRQTISTETYFCGRFVCDHETTFPAFGRCSGWIWKEDCTMRIERNFTTWTDTYRHDRVLPAALCKLKLEGAVRSSPLHVCISYALFPTCRCVQSRAKPIPLGRSMRASRIYQLIVDWFIARKKSKKIRRTHEWNCFRWFRHTRLRARTNVSPWLFIRRYFMKAVC